MISALIYGRNDIHGMHSQRRTALSINALAASLTHEDDEIIFVDYNSDDDVATFIDAIVDTLSPEAILRLRVVRVRPNQHKRLAGEDAPPVVESIARNIGLRHSNAANNWVLSTNTDIVIVPDDISLSQIVAKLETAHYGTARYELPRFLWQGIDRKIPADATRRIRLYAASLHLDEIVRHYIPGIGFDAPGDFQLMPRHVLFEIGGFDEAMKRAWHVDSNLMARLALRFGPARAIQGLRLYHCEHTTDTVPKHSAGRVEDNFDDFVAHVTDPVANHGKPWGGAGIAFELARPADGVAFSTANSVASAIGAHAEGVYSAVYGPETFGTVPRVNRHVLPFVVDRLNNLPRNTTFHWLGADQEMLELVRNALYKLGFTSPIQEDGLDVADILLVDAPVPFASDTEASVFWGGLGRLVVSELTRSRSGLPPRKVIAMNAVHSDLETVLLRHFDVVLAPFTTRLRPASIKSGDRSHQDWLPHLRVGAAGFRDHNTHRIDIVLGREGHVFFGPYRILQPGPHRLEVVATRALSAFLPRPAKQKLLLEVVLGDAFLAQNEVTFDLKAASSKWNLDFCVPAEIVQPHTPGVEIRFWSNGAMAGSIIAATVHCED